MTGQHSTLARCAVAALLSTALHAGADAGSDWPVSGADRHNTRHQASEHAIGVDNVHTLKVKWALTTQGDVSATPAVDDTSVYVPDWSGRLYAVDRTTGAVRWSVYLPDVTGVPFDKARATPTIAGQRLIIGTQGSVLVPGGGSGGKVLAFDKATGQLLWSTQADSHPAAIITQSATVFGNRVFVGVTSLEEAMAAFVPGYQLSFRGSFLALDLATGKILWKTWMAPSGFTGSAVWGSSPAIDVKRGQLYIATGNNYSVPPDVLACVTAAAGEPIAVAACLPADDYFDTVLALDMATGAVRWATRAIPYDTWTVDCIPNVGTGALCPSPAGPDYDFGQAPALFLARGDRGRPVETLGAGQKSGQYWALDPDTGSVRWVTQAGPGGTAGGLQWGSAVDGRRVYVSDPNSNAVLWTTKTGVATTHGGWSALDALSGALLWQTVDPNVGAGGGGGPAGPVSSANGVVYGCSLDEGGHMYAMNAATGDILWTFRSGGSCLSGAAISDGIVFWGSGYTNNGFGTQNNKLYAFKPGGY